MPPEVTDKEVTPVVTTTTEESAAPKPLSAEEEAEAEGNFTAGFKVARGEEPHAEDRPKTETPSAPATAKVEAPAKAEPATAPDDPEIPGLGKASEIKAKLEKLSQVEATLRTELATVRDSAAGRMGQLQQVLEGLKKNPATGQPQKITVEQLKRLGTEYPELSEALAEDLSALVMGSGAVDVAALEKSITDRVEVRVAEATKELADARRQMQVDLLTIRHSDWRVVEKAPDFLEWKATLPEEARTFLKTSANGMALAEAFDDYKAWLKNGKKPPGEEPPAPDPEAKAKEKRVAANAPAPSNGTPASSALLTEEDSFQAGYRAVRPKGS